MIFRRILAAAAVAAGIAGLSAGADAKTNVHVGIGIGAPGYLYDPYEHYGEYPGYPPYYRPGYYRPYSVRRISCGIGANIVRNHGYRRVYARDCGGRTYSYFGLRRGVRFIVFVNARNGAIVDRRPAY
jgi:hypothetical protein